MPDYSYNGYDQNLLRTGEPNPLRRQVFDLLKTVSGLKEQGKYLSMKQETSVKNTNISEKTLQESVKKNSED